MSTESAHAVEPPEAVTLRRDTAVHLADAVRAATYASRDLLAGGRRLDGEDREALKKAATRLVMLVFEADFERPDNLVDLAAERARRRR